LFDEKTLLVAHYAMVAHAAKGKQQPEQTPIMTFTLIHPFNNIYLCIDVNLLDRRQAFQWTDPDDK
jgi:hypothetical protein